MIIIIQRDSFFAKKGKKLIHVIIVISNIRICLALYKINPIFI